MEKKEIFIQNILSELDLINFDENKSVFHLNSKYPDKKSITQLYALTDYLRNNPISSKIKSTPLKDIKTGYRDRCLQHYCYERINLRKKDKETCWTQNGLITHCLGSDFETKSLSTESKINLIRSLKEDQQDFVANSIYREFLRNSTILNNIEISNDGWIFFKADIPFIRQGIIPHMRFFLRKLLGYPKGKNIIKIVNSIKKSGWNDDLAIKPLVGVLGFSRKLQKYHVITGKHRIASLKYLESQNYVSQNLKINYPVISYDWGDWAQFVSYPNFSCKCQDVCKN